MFRYLLATMLVLFSLPSFAKEPSPEIVSQVMTNVVESFIRPNYLAFYKQSKDLEKSMTTLCANPSEKTLRLARKSFSNTAQTWGAIELIRFGPVAQNNRLERILFYPDRKSTGLKQVQRILAKKDTTSILLENFPNKSVAVQGLGALEFILSGTGSETLTKGNKFRCQFGLNVASNIKNISSELVEAWAKNSNVSQIWTSPSSDNPVLKTPREAVNELLRSLVHGLESVRDIRIGSFLKKETNKDRPRGTLFRRSENTMAVIVSNIEAVKNLLVSSNAILLLDEEDQATVGTIVFELDNAVKVAKAIPEPVNDSLQNEVLRGQLVYLKFSLKFAITILDQDFAKAAGLSSGFSFSDGD